MDSLPLFAVQHCRQNSSCLRFKDETFQRNVQGFLVHGGFFYRSPHDRDTLSLT
jgi:hypothetical protein